MVLIELSGVMVIFVKKRPRIVRINTDLFYIAKAFFSTSKYTKYTEKNISVFNRNANCHKLSINNLMEYLR